MGVCQPLNRQNSLTCRLFYYNREEDKASWKPPRGIKNGQVVAKDNDQGGENETIALPQGYTEHQDLVSGATYFVVRLKSSFQDDISTF